MAHRTFLIALLALACLLTPPELSGQVTPVAGPFEVSPRSYGSRDTHQSLTLPPSLAAVSDGSFVVAWEQDLNQRFTGINYLIYTRQIRADGRPGRLVLTGENDGFRVAWRGPSPHGPLIRISDYTIDGIRAGTALLGTSSGTWSIHMNRQGKIAFVWAEPDGRVLLQVLDQFLVPRGSRQWVTRTGDEPWAGDVVISDTGRVLVVWISSLAVNPPDDEASHRPLVGKLWQIEE